MAVWGVLCNFERLGITEVQAMSSHQETFLVTKTRLFTVTNVMDESLQNHSQLVLGFVSVFVS